MLHNKDRKKKELAEIEQVRVEVFNNFLVVKFIKQVRNDDVSEEVIVNTGVILSDDSWIDGDVDLGLLGDFFSLFLSSEESIPHLLQILLSLNSFLSSLLLVLPDSATQGHQLFMSSLGSLVHLHPLTAETLELSISSEIRIQRKLVAFDFILKDKKLK